MRRLVLGLVLACCVLQLTTAHAATGKVIKVLPQYLDKKGRTSTTPSLYERDAYQVQLRTHPSQRSGMRFQIQWKTRGKVTEPLTLKVQLRGIAEGNLPRQTVLEKEIQPGGWFSHWTSIDLGGERYKEFGDVVAWRVTLWEGSHRLGEEKSFLW